MMKEAESEWMKIRINLIRLSRNLPEQITVKQLADILGINTKQAGKILARMERLSIYKRIGRNTFRRVI